MKLKVTVAFFKMSTFFNCLNSFLRLHGDFAKAGLDNETSAMCKHYQRFGLDGQFSALVHNLNNLFLNGHLFRDVFQIPCLRKYSTLVAIHTDITMDRSYLFKHWLATLIFAPFLPTVYDLFINPVEVESLGLLDLYPIILLFSFVLSIPTLIVYYFVFSYLIKRQANPVSAKLILITLTIIGIAITLLIIGGSITMTLIYSFSLSTIITGTLIRIKSKIASIKNINAVFKPDN